MSHYLVVANQTATGPSLLRVVSELAESSDTTFRLVVPATSPKDHLTWTEGTAYGLAHRRLLEGLDVLRSAGAQAEGWVGDADPYTAITDALRNERFDEVILSTFPLGLSRWLHMDVASRVEKNFGVHVRLVVSPKSPVLSTR